MSGNYPRSMADLAAWARENAVTATEARQRLVQFAVLCAISSVPALRESLVFKGGNALDFVHQPNRSTLDLDFSLDADHALFDPGIDAIRELLGRGLHLARQRFGIALILNSVRQQPPGAGKTFVTFTARVGYGLPDEHQLLMRMANNLGTPRVLPIEISLNEPIGDATRIALDEEFTLRVSTLEDIVSEKLRSLLQQPIRNRHRRQDVLDIAVTVGANPDLDRVKIASFLVRKAKARGVPVSKGAFHHPEIANRARVDYDALAPTTRTTFISFDQAFATVLDLVDTLSIPDE